MSREDMMRSRVMAFNSERGKDVFQSKVVQSNILERIVERVLKKRLVVGGIDRIIIKNNRRKLEPKIEPSYPSISCSSHRFSLASNMITHNNMARYLISEMVSKDGAGVDR